MKQLKIGIVEDNLLIAESIVDTIKQIGYDPVNPVRNYDDALQMIETISPDLVIIDITLEGKLDGIDLALKLNQSYGIPFIFLTAHSDPATVNRAKKANPYAYLVKPFTEQDLFSSIEIAFNNHNRLLKSVHQQQSANGNLNDILFIKEGDLFFKVKLSDILYIKSENVYLNIYTAEKHYVIRNKLEDFLHEFIQGDFVRVHRSYAINLKHLEALNSLSAIVAGKEVPINKTYKLGLMEIIKAFK